MAVVVADGIDRYLRENYAQSLRVPVNFCLISPGLVTVLSVCLNPDCPVIGYPPATLPEPRLPWDRVYTRYSAWTQTALNSGIHPLHCLNRNCSELGYPPATLYEFQCYEWFWSCLPFWTTTWLHSVSYTTLFFWHPHAENPAIQMQESWLSCFLLRWTPHLELDEKNDG